MGNGYVYLELLAVKQGACVKRSWKIRKTKVQLLQPTGYFLFLIFQFLLDHNFFNYFFSQRFIYPFNDFVLLVQEFIFKWSHLCADEEGMINDLYFVCVFGNGFTHDVFPDIFYLQCLYAAFETTVF